MERWTPACDSLETTGNWNLPTWFLFKTRKGNVFSITNLKWFRFPLLLWTESGKKRKEPRKTGWFGSHVIVEMHDRHSFRLDCGLILLRDWDPNWHLPRPPIRQRWKLKSDYNFCWFPCKSRLEKECGLSPPLVSPYCIGGLVGTSCTCLNLTTAFLTEYILHGNDMTELCKPVLTQNFKE